MMRGDDPGATWAQATRTCCAAPDALLLAADGLLGAPDPAATSAELDDQSRLLFGLAGDPAGAVARLATVFEHDLGYRADRSDRSEYLSLTRVVATRTGHPIVLAVVAVALLRRAGIPAVVCHATDRWLAAASGSPLVVLDLEPGSRPSQVRPVCGHLVGVAVLSGLQRAYAGEQRDEHADACGRLVEELPTVEAGG